MSLFATSLLLLGCSCFASATAPGWNAVREVTKIISLWFRKLQIDYTYKIGGGFTRNQN
jgi:hypothetical protein